MSDKKKTGTTDEKAVKLYDKGLEILQNGDPEKALKKFNDAAAIAPDDTDIVQAQAICYFLLGDMESAVKNYNIVLRLSPEFLPGYLYLAGALINMENEEEAVDVLMDGIEKGRELLQDSTENIQIMRDLAALYIKMEAFDEAAKLLYQVLNSDSEDAESYQMLGDVLYEMGFYPEAISICRKALNLDPEDASSHLYMGLSYQKMNLLSKAIAEFKESIRLRPDQPELKELISHLTKVKKEFGPSIEELIDAAPDDPVETGVIRWFAGDKGIGFITGPNGEEIFLHYTAAEPEDLPILSEGLSVNYVRIDTIKGALAAHLRLSNDKPEARSGKVLEFDPESGSGIIVLEDGSRAILSLFGMVDPLMELHPGDQILCFIVETQDDLVAMGVTSEAELDEDRISGQIKWYDEKARNGVIVSDGGVELLFHSSAITGVREISKGLRVCFSIDQAESLDGTLVPRAVDIRPLNPQISLPGE